MAAAWTSTGPCHDTGNGALIGWFESRDYPGVTKISFSSYCGREADREWYEAIGDSERREYTTPAKADERYRSLNRELAAERELRRVKAELERRGITL